MGQQIAEANRKTGKILYPEDIADSVIYVLSTPPHVQVIVTVNIKNNIIYVIHAMFSDTRTDD